MPSNITNSESFTTGNMKPSPGEQIDALWGQNIASNTGHVFYRQIYMPGLVLNTPLMGDGEGARRYAEGTIYLMKYPGFGTLYGSFLFKNTDDSDGNFGMLMPLGGSQFVSYSDASSGESKGHFGHTGYAGLTDGSFYEFSGRIRTSAVTGSAWLCVTMWIKP